METVFQHEGVTIGLFMAIAVVAFSWGFIELLQIILEWLDKRKKRK